MFEPAIRLVLDTAFGLITYSFLLRFAMQWLRAPFRNPLGRAVVALTDWAAKPARKVIPGYKGLDVSTLVLAWISQFAWLAVIVLLLGPGGIDGTTSVRGAPSSRGSTRMLRPASRSVTTPDAATFSMKSRKLPAP